MDMRGNTAPSRSECSQRGYRTVFRREPNTQSLAWFRDQFVHGKLNLQPPFQRNPVWSRAYRERFIETLLLDMPSPVIILHSVTTPDGNVKYEVVDGKQRLSAALDFIGLKTSPDSHAFVASKTSPKHLAGKTFVEFPDEDRTKLFRYVFTVQMIENATEAELRDVFERLNRNVMKLTQQELRNAQYSGEFITLMGSLADDEFWQQTGLVTPAKIRRMNDVEIISELFLLTMHGILEGDDDTIDTYYLKYEEGLPESGEHLAKFHAVKDMIRRLGLPRQSRYKNVADFYSLWAGCLKHLDRAEKVNYEATRTNLLRFAELVEMKPEPPAGSDAAPYLVAARQGSNKQPNRSLRTDILIKQFVIED